jgi:hypothetical protein
MLRVFIGFDERQRVSFTTLATSIFETMSKPVLVSPLVLDTLPITRRGLTPFTFSRFLVPWLCDFQGGAVFMDADMLLASDINELEGQIVDDIAVSVVRSLEQYEQTSFMLFNCAHPAHKKLSPEFIQNTEINLHSLEWVSDKEVGALDPKWNQLVGYQEVDLSKGNIHYTMGIPAFPETSTSVGADLWRKSASLGMTAIPWVEIMGGSVHAVDIAGVKLPRYVWNFDIGEPYPEHLELVKKLVAKHRLSEPQSL